MLRMWRHILRAMGSLSNSNFVMFGVLALWRMALRGTRLRAGAIQVKDSSGLKYSKERRDEGKKVKTHQVSTPMLQAVLARSPSLG